MFTERPPTYHIFYKDVNAIVYFSTQLRLGAKIYRWLIPNVGAEIQIWIFIFMNLTTRVGAVVSDTQM